MRLLDNAVQGVTSGSLDTLIKHLVPLGWFVAVSTTSVAVIR